MDILADAEDAALAVQLHEGLVAVAGRGRQQGAEGAFFLQKDRHALLLKDQVAFQQEKAAVQLPGKQAQAVHGAGPLVPGIFQQNDVFPPGQVLLQPVKAEAPHHVELLDAAVLQDADGPVQDRLLPQGKQRRGGVEILPAARRQDHRRPYRSVLPGEGELHLLAVQKGVFQGAAAPVRQREAATLPVPLRKEIAFLLGAVEQAVHLPHRHGKTGGQLPLVGVGGLVHRPEYGKEIVHGTPPVHFLNVHYVEIILLFERVVKGFP